MDSQELRLRREKELLKVKQTFLKLQSEIRAWQKENGFTGLEDLRPAEFSPYFTLDSLPEKQIIELWHRLNQASNETTETAELYSYWKEFLAGKTGDNYSLFSRLHLAISGVAQLAYKQLELPVGDEDQSIGPCPVCGAEKFIATLVPPVGKRYLHCLTCSYERPVMSSGCAHCGSEEASRQTYLHSEEFPGIEMAACMDCGRYFKQMDLREVTAEDLVWEDIRTLPLNYAAEQWLSKQLSNEEKIMN